MKKLQYLLLSCSTVILFACGGSDHAAEDASTDESSSESEMMDHDDHADHGEAHDHEAMMEEAKSNEFIKAPAGARVFFANLKEGDRVTSPVKIVMGVEGMTVHPAGEIIEGTGHHHIILSGASVPEGEPVPADEQHIHYGGGQTDVEVPLDPGVYLISLQFADGLHRSYGEEMSTHINIEVVPK